MGNFYAYPGRWLVATQPRPGIEVGKQYQLINARHFFTFTGVMGQFEATGIGWEPVEGPTENKVISKLSGLDIFVFWAVAIFLLACLLESLK